MRQMMMMEMQIGLTPCSEEYTKKRREAAMELLQRQADAADKQKILAGTTEKSPTNHHQQLLAAGVSDGRKMSHIDMGMPHVDKDNRKTSKFGFDNPLSNGKGPSSPSIAEEPPANPNNIIAARRASRGNTPTK